MGVGETWFNLLVRSGVSTCRRVVFLNHGVFALNVSQASLSDSQARNLLATPQLSEL